MKSILCVYIYCELFCFGKCLMNELIKIDSCILTLDEKSFTKPLLYWDGRYDNKTNKYSFSFCKMSFILVKFLMDNWCDIR